MPAIRESDEDVGIGVAERETDEDVGLTHGRETDEDVGIVQPKAAPFKGAAKGYMQFAGSVPKGLALLSQFGSMMSEPGVIASPEELRLQRESEARTAAQKLAAAKASPLYKMGEVTQQAAPSLTPEQQASKWTQFGEMVGGVGGMALGPLAIPAFSLSAVGEAIDQDYQTAKQENPDLSDSEVADKVMTKALAKGAVTAAVFTALPPAIRAPLEKYLVAKFGTTAFKNWLAGRGASALETGTIMGAQSAGVRAVEGKAPDADTAKSFAAGALFGLVAPWRESQKTPTEPSTERTPDAQREIQETGSVSPEQGVTPVEETAGQTQAGTPLGGRAGEEVGQAPGEVLLNVPRGTPQEPSGAVQTPSAPRRFVWPGHESLVSKDASTGKWRVTEFEVLDDGSLKPLRHDIFDTYESAVESEASNKNRKEAPLKTPAAPETPQEGAVAPEGDVVIPDYSDLKTVVAADPSKLAEDLKAAGQGHTGTAYRLAQTLTPEDRASLDKITESLSAETKSLLESSRGDLSKLDKVSALAMKKQLFSEAARFYDAIQRVKAGEDAAAVAQDIGVRAEALQKATESPKKGKAEAPAAPKVLPSAAAREFKALVQQNALQHGWVDDASALDPFADLKTGHGTASVKSKVARDKALAVAYRRALKDLGIENPANSVKAHAEALPKLKAFLEAHAKLQPVKLEDLPNGSTFTRLGEKFTVKETNPDTGIVTVVDGRTFKVHEGGTIGVDPGSVKAKPQGTFEPTESKPDLTLSKPETVEEQKARMAAEESARKAKADKEVLAEKASDPLVGSVGDIGQMDLAGGGDLFSQTPKQIVGMGGAVPSEFGQPSDYVSNMFAAIDRDRAAMGKPPMPPGKPRTWGEDADIALAEMRRNPNWADDLLAEVSRRPRPLLSWEHAGLVFHKAKLKAELHNAYKDVYQSFEDGRAEDNAAAKVRAAVFEDKILELNKAVGRGGTGSESGRSLQAQKMAVGDEDFTLVEMVLEKRAALGGRKLTDAEHSEIKKLHAEIERTKQEFENFQRKVEVEKAEAAMNDAFKSIQLEAARESSKPKVHPKILEAASAIVAKIDEQANASRAWLRGKSFALEPETLYHIARVGASHLAHAALDFAEWSTRMVQDLGEKIKPHLQEVWKETQRLLDQNLKPVPEAVRKVVKSPRAKTPAEDRTTIVGSVIAKVNRKEINSIGPLARKLALSFMKDGLRGREEVIDAVHDLLKDAIPDWTRRKTMDAISGYGDFKPLNKDAILTELRGYKGEMQQLAKIEDIQSRQPPLKSGLERRKQTDEERRLIKLVNEAKRRFGIVVTDPATQLRSALDARKTYYQNQITDLQAQIDAKEKFVKTKTPSPTDPELDALKKQRDSLKSQFDAMFKQPMSDAQRLQLATRAAERQLADWQTRLQDAQKGQFKRPPGAPKLTSPQIDAIKAQVESIKAEIERLNEIANPKATPEQIALKTWKTRTTKAMADLQDRLASGDFSARPRRKTVLDEEGNRLKARYERTKQDFKQAMEADRLKNRTNWEKFMDWGTKYRRFGVLSSPVVIPKLISAGLQRLGSLPIEELAGEAWSRIPIVSRISRIAPLEGGGSNLAAEFTGWRAAWKKGFADAYKILRTGRSDLDVLWGKPLDTYSGEPDLGSVILSVPGRIHGMIKAPVKRAAFDRASERLAKYYSAQGLDVTDNLVKTRIATEAYKAANRSIFLDNNFVADRVNAFLGEKIDPQTGHPTPGSKLWATVGRVALPIVRVPTNIVAETMQYAGGLVSAHARIAAALRKGVDTLTPEQADLIMRELKKGSIGGAALLLGYLNADKIGGFYQPGKKRKEGELKPGSIKVFGQEIPYFLLHNPLLETLQVGATVRRVADSHLRKKDTETQGLAAGVGAAALGLVEEVPFVREMGELEKLRNPYQRGAFVGEQAKSILVPSAVQKAAEWTDKGVTRKPQTVLEHVEMGVPGLRQRVGPKKDPSLDYLLNY